MMAGANPIVLQNVGAINSYCLYTRIYRVIYTKMALRSPVVSREPFISFVTIIKYFLSNYFVGLVSHRVVFELDHLRGGVGRDNDGVVVGVEAGVEQPARALDLVDEAAVRRPEDDLAVMAHGHYVLPVGADAHFRYLVVVALEAMLAIAGPLRGGYMS